MMGSVVSRVMARRGGWLEQHSRRGWSYQQSLQRGMTDIRDLQKRAEQCLPCHSGIDHGLLAAGHPDLVFELDTFSAVMPKHWQEKLPLAGARAWAIGQAVALQRSIEKMLAGVQEKGRLDWSDRTCFSCHHTIFAGNWTINPDSTGRPGWNASRWAVFRHFLRLAFPKVESVLAKPIEQIEQEFRAVAPKVPLVAEACSQLLVVLKDLVPQVNRYPMDSTMIRPLLASISQDERIAQTGGFRVAEQGLMALDALTLSLPKKDPGRGVLRQQIKKLYDLLDVSDPSHHDPAHFARAMAEFHLLLE